MRFKELFETTKPIDIDFHNFDELLKLRDEYRRSSTILWRLSVPASVKPTINELHSLLDTKIIDMEAEIEAAKKPIISLIKTIKKECSEIWEQYADFNSFYYSQFDDNTMFLIGKTDDTNTLETPNLRIFNDLMKEKGIQPNLENTIEMVNLYSLDKIDNAYMIFPKDGFKYIWSNIAEDPKKFINSSKCFDSVKEDEAAEKLKDSLGNTFYSLFSNAYEIFSSYYWEDHYKTIQKLYREELIPKEVFDLFSPQNLITENSLTMLEMRQDEGLRRAINRDHSIFFSGEFYAVSAKHRILFENYLYNAI